MLTRNRIILSFYIKRTKLLKNGTAPIYLRIKVNSDSAELAIMRNIRPELWSTEKNGAIGISNEAREINNYMHHVRKQVEEHIVALRDDEVELTARRIKNSYLGIKDDEKTIVHIFTEHNKNVHKLIGKDFSKATHFRYVTCLKHLVDYMQLEYKVKDLALSKIDQKFIQGFEIYLKVERNCNHNTAVKYVKNFKKIMRHALGSGLIKSDPFVNVKLRVKKVDKGFLTEDEIKAIKNKQFPTPRLQQVADIFLFGCFTGYAYSDLMRLKQSDLEIREGGQVWIMAKRTKTDMACHVPLLPQALQILEKYENNEYCQKNQTLLPNLSNQKLNAYLKEVADLCGITKTLTSHIARHTFATTITLNNGIPIESVSKMLGHSSIKMTEIYAKILDKKVADDMSKLSGKFGIDDF